MAASMCCRYASADARTSCPISSWIATSVRLTRVLYYDRYDFGCATTRRYGFRVFQPFGNCFLASSSDTDGTMITS